MSMSERNVVPPPPWGGRRARLGRAKPPGAPGGGLPRGSPHPAAAACEPASTLPVKGRDGEWRIVVRGARP